VNTTACDFQQGGKGISNNNDPYSDGCPYVHSYSNEVCSDVTQNALPLQQNYVFGEYYSTASRCFQSNIIDVRYTSSASPQRCYET
jgi:hypothetical protein